MRNQYFTTYCLLVVMVCMSVSTGKRCPSSKQLSPCVCIVTTFNEYNIECYGKSNYNLKLIFESISDELSAGDRHFDTFYLNNTAINEFAEDVFHGITFDEIFVDDASNLTRVHSHAFTATNSVVKSFDLYSAPIAVSASYDAFDAFSLMNNLQTLTLFNTSLTAIPERAFRPLNGANNISGIYVTFNERLRTLGNNAFYELDHLENVVIDNNAIDYIPEHAFSFRHTSNKTLYIGLGSNRLNATNSFALGCFSAINRKFKLDLSSNHNLNYLDEKTFDPVLAQKNSIVLYGIKLVCDCRMRWIVNKRQLYSSLVEYAVCDDGYDLFNTTRVSFLNC